MKFFTKGILPLLLTLIIGATDVLAYSGGSQGNTTGKTSTTSVGCGSCHGSSSNSSTSVTRSSGSTTVNAGSTTTFTIQVAHSSRSAAGINIAVKTDQTGNTNAGTLTEDESGLQMFDGEVTHNTPKSISGGSASFTVSWTAPTTAGTYYLRAIGNAVNGNTSADGNDHWNWMSPVAITVNAQPTLALTAPASGAVWCPSSTQNITWNSTGVSTIKIEISSDGSAYTTIAPSVTASAGTYSYSVPANTTPGSQYRIRITDNSNATLTSTSSAFSVGGAASITTQPTASQNVCPGQPVTFSVVASGAGNTYQWFREGQQITGATLASYTISGVATTDAGRYHVVVSNACTTTPVISTDAMLTVGTPTIITNSPVASQTVCPNQAVVLSATATGANLTYQWRKDGAAINGQTSPSMTVTVVNAQQEGSYTVTVTGTCGTQNSSPSVITLGKLPLITTNPTPQSVLVGSTAVFSVTASNVTTYQWRKDGLDIAGATTATLTIPNVKQSDAGDYDVRMVNNCGAAVSTPVKLTISQPGVGAIFTSSTLALDFGNIVTGTSVDKTLTITNTGDSTLKVTSATITGAGAANYSIISGGAPFDIAPNGTHSIGIRFTGSTAGSFTANLNFVSNSKTNPIVVLNGVLKSPESPVLTIESVRFDTTNVGTSSTKKVKIQNVGTVPSIVSSVAIEGPNAAAFSLPDQFSQFTLDAGQSVEINVQFLPTSAGEATANLRVVAQGGDLTAELAGYGKLVNSVGDFAGFISN
ncbi:MAG: choice-of-anchor V domain-containing protein, partial [Bacteroidota bacterium]